ncbi:MAG TPA: CaiB/BaiF CoA-transferase family protein [Verrucomicrobiae bacterium]|jgi:formyl-CoA transferase|nr:CaiB/BaiF CoA-transferase family protein [Verrucomicrobiae bacterium]
MKGPLHGLRVLDLGNFIAGPFGAMFLADLGAEVIKVENPKGGDPYRAWDLGGDRPNFWGYNRGKKSVTLNLRTPEGRDMFYKLCRKADVLVENYRPGVAKTLGIDYETLHAMNEKLIYCSITGMGATGPYASRPAYDTVGQGLGGMMSLLMDRDNPRPIGPAFADCLGGMFGAIGVLGALHARAETGRGQHVATSMVGAILGFLTAPATEYLASGDVPGPTSRPQASQTYACACSDGLLLAIHLSSPPKFWEGLCRAMDRGDLIDDPRFKSRADRRRNYNMLGPTLNAIMKQKPRSYWLERLEAEDVPHTPVYDMAELFQDPHIKHMGMEIEIPRDNKPAVRTVRFPIDYSETAVPHPAPAPDLGEHNLEIFKPLGWDEKALAELKDKGVV